MIFNRQTLANSTSISGLGLHSGEPVTMCLKPGDNGIGFWFSGTRVSANPNHVTDTKRSTKLGEIGTVEHLMAALAGLEITDVEVELSYPEIPGMDGSSKPFCDALIAAGLTQICTSEIQDLYARVFHQESDLKVAVGKGNGHWRYEYETGDRWPGSMHYEAKSVTESFVNEIAPARTFALSEELPFIKEHGLAKGLSLESAVILGESGYENGTRFADEPARHKLLDMVGDLYLSGIPVKFLNVVGSRNGHRANVLVAQMLQQATTKG